jgi:WD40 repeat protein
MAARMCIFSAWIGSLILATAISAQWNHTITHEWDVKHPGPGLLESMAISPDGSKILSSSTDGTIILWDMSDGTPLRAFEGHDGFAYCTAFSPDGKTFVSGGGDDMLIKIWDVDSSEPRQTLTGHGWRVQCIAVSPDGKTIISGSGDGTIRKWDMSSGALLWTRAAEGSVRTVAITPDGSMIVSGDTNKQIKIWNMSDGSLIRTLTGHGGSVYIVAITPDGNTIVSGHGVGYMVWNIADSTLRHDILTDGGVTRDLAISLDETTLVLGTGDQTMTVWDFQNGELLQTFDLDDLEDRRTNVIMDVAISPDGSSILSGGSLGTITLWDVSPPFGTITSIATKQPHVPTKVSLLRNAPNPFNAETVIYFQVQTSNHVTLRIYSLTGRLIRELLSEKVEPGHGEITWDGTSAEGRPVGSGVYFYELKTSRESIVRRMTLLR